MKPNPAKKLRYSYIAAEEWLSLETSSGQKRACYSSQNNDRFRIAKFGWKNLIQLNLQNSMGETTTLSLTRKQFIWNPLHSKYIKAYSLVIGDRLFAFAKNHASRPQQNVWSIVRIEHGGYREVMELVSDRCQSYYLGAQSFGMAALQCYSDHSYSESYGIVAFRVNPANHEREYLLIQRRHTMGYMDMIRGKYCDKAVHEICQIYLQEMTIEERERIVTWPFEKLWFSIWNANINDYNAENFQSQITVTPPWMSLQQYEIAKGNFSKLPLHDWIERLGPSFHHTAEYGLPKGRANLNETALNAALREFTEEVGCNVRYRDVNDTSSDKVAMSAELVLEMNSNRPPFIERFQATNGLNYLHTYFLAFIPDVAFRPQVDSTNLIQANEIGAVEFCTLNEALQKFRSYDYAKKQVLIKIDSSLRSQGL